MTWHYLTNFQNELSVDISIARDLHAAGQTSLSQLTMTTVAMNSQAAYLALRNDSDDESTLVGSRIVGSDRSMEYSRDGASTSTVSIDGSSLASSLFQGDGYFQDPESAPPDWSHYNEERGRQLAKTLIQQSAAKRKKTGLLQRAVRAFRRRKARAEADKLKLQCSTSEDEFSDGEITFDQDSVDPWQDGTAWQGEKTKATIELAREEPPRDLDEISDCTSDATSNAAVEVWLPSDASTSPTDEEDDDDSFSDMLKGESPIPMPSPRRHRDHDQFFPDGLFVRTTAEEVVDKLKLGDTGQSALQTLDEATAAATESFDPSQCTNPDVVPTLVTIGNYSVPDFQSYVRQAVNSFRKNVLQMSDDLYDLMERRMAAKNLVISKARLLPFAVELYALERITMMNASSEVASI